MTKTALRPGVVALLLVVFQSNAQSVDPEWPCIQVLVPEIMIGVLWPMEITQAQQGLWEKDEKMRRAVEELSELDGVTEAEKMKIQTFAQSIPESERLTTLNAVAQGVVAKANRKRDGYIKGIKKYTRQQIAIAHQIESSLNELSALKKDSSSDPLKHAEVEETLAWHQRVYDQREHAIISLCEVPVELEEKLSSVVRELSQYLPY